MKQLTGFISFCLLATSVQAAPVLIDFNEVTPQSSMSGVVVETKGFTFTAIGIGSGPERGAGVSANGVWAESYCMSLGDPGNCGASISMESTSGHAFAIHSIATIEWFGSTAGIGGFSGVRAGGGSADLSVPIGTGDWLQLDRFRISASCFDSCGQVGFLIDDISATVVPIPAAAWLFASALLGLGWLRRRPA